MWRCALVASAAALAACTAAPVVPSTEQFATTTTTGAPTTTAPTSTTRPTDVPNLNPYGGEVVIGESQEPPTLNPFAPGGDSEVVRRVGNLFLAGVWDVDPNTLELVPDIVTSLPTVSNGGLLLNDDGTETVIYRIRDDAEWEDGAPISGDDLLFTYETIMDRRWGIPQDGYGEIVPGSIITGPKSFEYTLRNPTLGVESLFGVVLPAHQVAGTDLHGDWNDKVWLSGGPFVLERWEPGEYISFTRNPRYWKRDPATSQQLPYLDRVIFRFGDETSSLLDTFAGRGLDVVSPPATPEVLQALEGALNEGAVVAAAPGGVLEYLSFQFGPNRRLAHPSSYNPYLDYRIAVANAVDRERIIAEGLGLAMEPAYSLRGGPGPWDEYGFHPDRSLGLLEALCATSGVECGLRPVAAELAALDSPESAAVATLLSQMFDEVGIGFAVDFQGSATFFGNTLDFGVWDLGRFSLGLEPGLAGMVGMLEAFDPSAPPPDGGNFARWGTPAVSNSTTGGFNQGASSVRDAYTSRFSEILAAMSATVDTDELSALFAEAEAILADQMVIIPLYRRPEIGFFWGDEIHGYAPAPAVPGDTWNIASWYRVEA